MAGANVIVNGTRVVFPAQRGETTLRLTNGGDRPALVEAWIDSGDVHSTPDTAQSPFLITPPLFRVDPHKDQSLRILFVQGAEALPADRESLFWLNVLDVPPKPDGQQYEGKNYLQFAIRSRLKLFYRPAGLPGDALKAPAQLVFKVAAGSAAALDVHNPTPYYVTIIGLGVGAGSKPLADIGGMVAPFGDLRLPLGGAAPHPAPGAPVVFTTINDYGAEDAHTSTLVR